MKAVALILLILVPAALGLGVYNYWNKGRLLDANVSEIPVYRGFLKTVIKPKTTTLLLGGDVMLGRSVMTRSLRLGDFFYPFREVSGLLQSADLTVVNLESSIVDTCPKTDSGMIFCTNYDLAKGLKEAGIDLVSLANNHILNFGEEGLSQTREFLEGEKIGFLERGILETRNIKGVSFGFLAFDLVSKVLGSKELEIIKEANSKVDFLVMSVHWGAEYQSYPSQKQKAWAKEMVLAGAEVIVGHHSHWVQAWEYLEGKPVFYSLGNLVFDQMWSEKTRQGMLAEITIKGEKIIGVKTYNTYMRNFAQPEVVD